MRAFRFVAARVAPCARAWSTRGRQRLYIEAELDDIAVLHDVFLALDAELAGGEKSISGIAPFQ
jgi:hypothetical protein